MQKIIFRQDSKQLNRVNNISVFSGEKDVDFLEFLIPLEYNGIDLSDCNVRMSYVTGNGFEHSFLIDEYKKEELYENEYFIYLVPVSPRFTSVEGTVNAYLSITKMVDGVEQKILKTGDVEILIRDHLSDSSQLNEEDIEIIDQVVLISNEALNKSNEALEEIADVRETANDAKDKAENALDAIEDIDERKQDKFTTEGHLSLINDILSTDAVKIHQYVDDNVSSYVDFEDGDLLVNSNNFADKYIYRAFIDPSDNTKLDKYEVSSNSVIISTDDRPATDNDYDKSMYGKIWVKIQRNDPNPPTMVSASVCVGINYHVYQYVELQISLSDYYTKSEVNDLLDNKQNTLINGNGTSVSNNKVNIEIASDSQHLEIDSNNKLKSTSNRIYNAILNDGDLVTSAASYPNINTNDLLIEDTTYTNPRIWRVKNVGSSGYLSVNEVHGDIIKIDASEPPSTATRELYTEGDYVINNAGSLFRCTNVTRTGSGPFTYTYSWDIYKMVTQQEKDEWSAKQDALIPNNGININNNNNISVKLMTGSSFLHFDNNALGINVPSLYNRLITATSSFDPLTTKSYVDGKLSGKLKKQIVTELPTEDIDKDTIYMILRSAPTINNIYDEYMYVIVSDDPEVYDWELIGSTEVDLTNYYTKTESDTKFQNKLTVGNGIDITSDEIRVLLMTGSSYLHFDNKRLGVDITSLYNRLKTNISGFDPLTSKSYVDNALADKQDIINAQNKLDADLVDDTSSDNKFVTLTDIIAWNNKQEPISQNNKLDADLVDDSTSTNKFTNASEKQTWNGKQDKLTAGKGIRIESEIGSNMFDVSAVVNGYLASNGTIAQNDDLRTSDYIEMEANKTYTISSNFINNSQYFIATYDTNKANGTRINVSHGTNVGTNFHYLSFTASANGYFRFSYDKNETNVMANEGDTYKPYEPYGEIDNVISCITEIGDIIIVDKNGNGDYTTLTEAVTYATNESTILILEGVYNNEIVKAGDKDLSIIGVDKTKCIIQNDSGAYNDDPLHMTSGYLANVTIKAKEPDNYVYDSNVSENYCLHIDAGGVGKELLVENCNFIAENWACLGIGLHQDQKVTIKNCEMIHLKNDLANKRLALAFHQATGTDVDNQLLILDNCRIRSKAGKTIGYQRVGTNSVMELRMYHNTFYDEINGVNCLNGNFSRNGNYLDDTQTLILSGDSTDNNVEDFNITSYEKKTDITTDTTSTTVSLTLADNHEYRYTQDLTSLTLTMPSGDFIASIVFASGSTPTSMTYDSNIKWSGDDVTNGQFVPTEKTYNIVLWYDGLNINGVVRGV